MSSLDAVRSGQLAGQKRLNLAGDLTEFPTDILALADSLEILDLANNRLSSLPDEFSQLQKLKAVFFTNNEFTEFPAVLAACPSLSMISFKGNKLKNIGEQILSPVIRWLILTDNQIEALPANIGNLSRLQKLMLAGNQLQSVPDELANCQNLELIRLAANRLETLPDCLLELPKLAWLAYAGNPFCQQQDSSQESDVGRSLPLINPNELQLGEILGQGASGIIHKAIWTPPVLASVDTTNPSQSSQPQAVAVKLFKGDITSDGLPLDEMQACISAGSHPSLVKVLGKLSQPIAGRAGLVFAFIPAEYDRLGDPPSLITCTRDTYAADTAFTLPVIMTIAKAIASAAQHIHATGIMHGDLYAHNILVNEVGNSVLGDFGAASFYNPADANQGQALERLEVRAFGCLLEDLLDHHTLDPDSQSDDVALISKLRRLQQDCLHPMPAQRPLFAPIHAMLMSEWMGG